MARKHWVVKRTEEVSRKCNSELNKNWGQLVSPVCCQMLSPSPYQAMIKETNILYVALCVAFIDASCQKMLWAFEILDITKDPSALLELADSSHFNLLELLITLVFGAAV